MTALALTILSLLVSGIVGYGFGLFVIESPYVKPLTERVARMAESAVGRKKKLLEILHKGMECYTCSGFWGGLLCGSVFVSPMSLRLSTLTIWAWLFCCALAGSAMGTAGSYMMNYYFDWRKLKGLSQEEPE